MRDWWWLLLLAPLVVVVGGVTELLGELQTFVTRPLPPIPPIVIPLPGGGPGLTTPGVGQVGVLVPPGNVSDTDRARLALAVGWTGDDAVTAVAISMAEDTTGDPRVLSNTNDLGLWQINQGWWPKFGGEQALINPSANAFAAHGVFEAQGWCAWSTFEPSCGPGHNSAYRGFLDRARAAVAEALANPSVQLPTATNDERFAAMWDFAQGWLGTPYLWGGTTRAGVDCSAFVQAVYSSIGVHLPRTTTEQRRFTTPVPRGQEQPGDVVFFDNTCSDCGGNPTHEGLYIGDGQMIQAGGSQVSIQPVFTNYYGDHYEGAGRLP